MSIPKIETYQVKDMELSIEDYKDKTAKHFMSDRPHKRYYCWCNGGGLGEASTLEEARQKLFDYVMDRLHDGVKKFTGELHAYLDAQRTLGEDTNNLQKFKVE